ncbi:substrate-binding periplasmic protein [Andreprevotia chitinilytica]|uniref:substrate-binding periplasmic protein n=1 Tax=Andreprevotia chitinilytica TaxID=396808 RepID=UPI00068C2E68|nr:transporter substrate-binding domain-containing protein [Andreprevotia chitinilytica]
MLLRHRLCKRFCDYLPTVMFVACSGLAAALPQGEASCKRVVISGDPEYPPLSWFDGKGLHGASLNIVTAALDRIHLPYEIRYQGPFLRVLSAAKSGAVDIVSELKNTPERNAFLAFPKTPIFVNPIAVFIHRDQKLAYKNWRDLIGLHGGITLGNKFGGGFDEFLTSQLMVEPAPKIEMSFAKLALKRIDYFVTGYYPGLSYLIETHQENNFVALQPFVTATDNYPGWSKASPCLNRLPEFDAALAELVRSGKTRQILDESLGLLRQYPVQSTAERSGI